MSLINLFEISQRRLTPDDVVPKDNYTGTFKRSIKAYVLQRYHEGVGPKDIAEELAFAGFAVSQGSISRMAALVRKTEYVPVFDNTVTSKTEARLRKLLQIANVARAQKRGITMRLLADRLGTSIESLSVTMSKAKRGLLGISDDLVKRLNDLPLEKSDSVAGEAGDHYRNDTDIDVVSFWSPNI